MVQSLKQVLAVLGAIAFVGPSAVNALGCYTSGETYASVGSDADIKSAASSACDAMAGSYEAGGSKSQCSTIGSNRVNWSVKNNAGNELTLSSADCLAAMTIEINACSMGSVQNHGSFQYQDDPNAGTC
ncbi:hypothetical protein PFICI_09152 [Pestalotiopsis fici W106-1]|uniref:Uncharacterized protein n=1 Tax=Pestalotiopsis fici (strain W106-1 / CGMCC3.15140) TaxID=1229662 RepID=W3WZW0_PESFW|nr:uncharacterized protein PFICI_09152 [Pestalotiopsis fici W106-1]ETS79299.1 hypothetical protein PFICI_09152 [Pestalotiopsis fici W106-1]